MSEYKVTLSAEQEKALSSSLISIQDWIEHAINNRARQDIDYLVTSSGLGSKFTDLDKKLEIIREMDIETVVEKNKANAERRKELG